MARAGRGRESRAHASWNVLAIEPDALPSAPVPRGRTTSRAGGEDSPPPSPSPAGPHVPQEVDRMSTQVRSELIDVLMDVYVDWREECIALRNAYQRW